MAYNNARLSNIALALVVLASAAASAPLRASDAGADVTSPIFVQGSGIRPVEAADGRIHLVYELMLANHGMMTVAIASIEALGPGDEVMHTVSVDDLRARSRQSLLGGDATVLQPSQSAMVFMDISLPTDASLPSAITHRFNATLSAPAVGSAASIGGLAVEQSGLAGPVAFRVANISIDPSPAIVLSPPVRGTNWVIFRGCCDLSTSHRGTTSFAGGEITVAERFAIDFVRTNDDGFMLTGPGNELASYIYLDEPVHAVADGIVVSARSDEPNQIPGTFPVALDDSVAGGNSVIIDIGNGHYALYAHLMPGSVTVEVGETVNAGDQIGRLGNSGRTIGPHLHFQLMDDADWRVGDGVPYVFDHFWTQGGLTAGALMAAMQGQPVSVEPGRATEAHDAQHPLNDQQISFNR